MIDLAFPPFHVPPCLPHNVISFSCLALIANILLSYLLSTLLCLASPLSPPLTHSPSIPFVPHRTPFSLSFFPLRASFLIILITSRRYLRIPFFAKFAAFALSLLSSAFFLPLLLLPPHWLATTIRWARLLSRPRTGRLAPLRTARARVDSGQLTARHLGTTAFEPGGRAHRALELGLGEWGSDDIFSLVAHVHMEQLRQGCAKARAVARRENEQCYTSS